MKFTANQLPFKLNFRPVVVVFLSFLFGIVSARYLYSGDIFYVVLVVASLGGVLVYGLFRKRYLFLMLAIVFFFAGNAGFFISYNSYSAVDYKEAFIVGRVNDKIEKEENYYSLILEDVIANEDQIGNVSLYVWSPQEGIEVGDVLTFTADLDAVKIFTLKSFNTWAFRRNITHSCFVEGTNVQLVSGGAKFDESARLAIKDLIYSNMSEKSASVAYALITGDQAMVELDVNQSYRDAGLIHILSVSGLHITFLATLIAFILKILKVNRYVNFGITFCIFLMYAYICDFLPSVVRAVIMGLIFIASGLFGKSYDGLSSLSIAGLLSLFISPLYAFDVGFLMSYACVGAIYILQPIFSKYLRKIFPRKVADLFALSFATQIGILPFLASFFSSLNLLSFFSNLIVVPIFSILFPALIIFVLIGLLIPSAGVLLVAIDWGLQLVLVIASFFASTDLQLSLNALDPIAITLLYMICLVASYYFMSSIRNKYAVTVLLATLFALFTLLNPLFYQRGSQISVLETYGSYNMVVESSSGQTLCLGEPAFRVNDYYKASGIDHFDYVLGGVTQVENAKMLASGEGQAGDFYYKTDGAIFIIEFDGVKILFTNDESISYNVKDKLREILARQTFDFVFIKDYDFPILKSYVACCDEEDIRADFSLQTLGNFTYNFDKKLAWGID